MHAKSKNINNLSKFTSISQPHLATTLNTSLNCDRFIKHETLEKLSIDNEAIDSNKKFLSLIEWSKESIFLNKILENDGSKIQQSALKNSFSSIESITDEFPILVKVVKGGYGIIKEASPSNLPHSNLLSKKYVNHLLLYGKSKSLFILCQSIKYKDKKPYVFGQNISIPITYNGWFEILSEDGKSIRPMLSIKELANHALTANNFKKLFNKPKNNISYIVRENINAYLIPMSAFNSIKIKNELAGTESDKYCSSIVLADCKTTAIKPGDILQVAGQVCISQSLGISNSFTSNKNKRVKMYKCYIKRKPVSIGDEINCTEFDKQSETVYLPENAQGKYSPVARIENISGVHKIVDLVKKFRFPVTVQLVYGRAPSLQNTTASTTVASAQRSHVSNYFSPILKLVRLYEEENIFAYPIGRETCPCLVQLPSRCNLQVLKATNMTHLLDTSNYLRLLLKECKLLAPEYSDMINNLPEPPPESSSTNSNALSTGIIQSCVKSLIGRINLVDNSFVNLKENSSSSLNPKKLKEHIFNINIESENTCNLSTERNNFDKEEENKTYKEIDDLYEYVRTGVLPEYIQIENDFSFKSPKTTSSTIEVSEKSLNNNQVVNTQNRDEKMNQILNKHLKSDGSDSKTKKKIQNNNNNNNNKLAEKPFKVEKLKQQNTDSFLPIYNTKANKRVNFSNINQYQQLSPPSIPPPPLPPIKPQTNQKKSPSPTIHSKSNQTFKKDTTNQPNTKLIINHSNSNTTIQEFKKSSSYQRIMTGGRSVCYQNQAECSKNELNLASSVNDNTIYHLKLNANEDWLDSIKRFNSFDLNFDTTKHNVSGDEIMITLCYYDI